MPHWIMFIVYSFWQLQNLLNAAWNLINFHSVGNKKTLSTATCRCDKTSDRIQYMYYQDWEMLHKQIFENVDATVRSFQEAFKRGLATLQHWLHRLATTVWEGANANRTLTLTVGWGNMGRSLILVILRHLESPQPQNYIRKCHTKSNYRCASWMLKLS